jgi:hypothetical protein
VGSGDRLAFLLDNLERGDAARGGDGGSSACCPGVEPADEGSRLCMARSRPSWAPAGTLAIGPRSSDAVEEEQLSAASRRQGGPCLPRESPGRRAKFRLLWGPWPMLSASAWSARAHHRIRQRRPAVRCRDIDGAVAPERGAGCPVMMAPPALKATTVFCGLATDPSPSRHRADCRIRCVVAA